jgi:hypothetical protein
MNDSKIEMKHIGQGVWNITNFVYKTFCSVLLILHRKLSEEPSWVCVPVRVDAVDWKISMTEKHHQNKSCF